MNTTTGRTGHHTDGSVTGFIEIPGNRSDLRCGQEIITHLVVQIDPTGECSMGKPGGSALGGYVKKFEYAPNPLAFRSSSNSRISDSIMEKCRGSSKTVCPYDSIKKRKTMVPLSLSKVVGIRPAFSIVSFTMNLLIVPENQAVWRYKSILHVQSVHGAC